jgi:hypothetical protein
MTITHKRDFSAPILDLKGKPVPQGVSIEALQSALDVVLKKVPESEHESVKAAIGVVLGAPMTFGDAIAHALTAPNQDDKLAPGEATKRMALALKIVNGGIVEITPDERDLMKRAIEKAYLGAVIPGRTIVMLETEDKPALSAVA